MRAPHDPRRCLLEVNLRSSPHAALSSSKRDCSLPARACVTHLTAEALNRLRHVDPS